MATFYACKPRPDGSEPVGSEDQGFMKYESERYAIQQAVKRFGPTARVYRVEGGRIYRPEAYRRIR